MQNLVFTQLSIPEIRELFRQELQLYFSANQHPSPPETDQQFTIKQAGDFLNLTVPTLYGYVHRAEIPVCKRGKRLYFSKNELIDWIKAGRKKTINETAFETEQYLLTKKGLSNGK